MATWQIDPSHSEVQFKVKHLVISTVTGSFKSFSGTVESEKEDFSDAKISFSADIASIDTNSEQRDGHLKSGDFFDAENHPTLSFESSAFTHVSGSDYVLEGNLTIKGVSKAVKLNVEFGGTSKDFYGNLKAGFDVTGSINRTDFGLSWNALTEAGGFVVSEEVKLVMSIQVGKPLA